MAKKYENKLTLPFPPTVNTYYRAINKGGFCRNILSAKGREYKAWVNSYLDNQIPTDQHLMVQIKLYAPDNRKRDIDNYIKALLDSMTGFIYLDDSQIDIIVICREEVIKDGKVEVVIKGL